MIESSYASFNQSSPGYLLKSRIYVQFTGWVSQELDSGAVFIFIDETYIHFGGQPRKKAKITKLKGTDPTPLARHEPPEQFQLMLWAAIGLYDDEIPFPF